MDLSAGGVAFLPRGVPHAYRITSDADLLVLSTPSGLERFFRGAGHDLSTPKPQGWKVTPETMGKAAAENGQIILGPPLDMDDMLPVQTDATPGAYVARADEHEIIAMLSGSGIYWVGEHRYELSAGGIVVVPRGVPMAHRITSDAEALAITTPGGLEAFFRMAGRDLSQPRPDGWQISYEVMGQASDATGQTVLAAPLRPDEMIPEEFVNRLIKR